MIEKGKDGQLPRTGDVAHGIYNPPTTVQANQLKIPDSDPFIMREHVRAVFLYLKGHAGVHNVASLISQLCGLADCGERTKHWIVIRYPILVEVGVNVLNPVQASARGMNCRRLKSTFGRDITFHGSIEKMGDAVDELLAEVKERIDVFAPGGGYIFASCNHIVDVEPQNIVAMFETAREYGRYS